MKKIFFILIVTFLLSSPCLAGEWDLTGSLNQGRECFCSVMLDDGRVLVAGGSNSGELSSCEIYDPETGQWSTTDSMNYARMNFSLTKFSDGRVLATGGYGYDTAGQTGEIFDPTTETWGESMTLNYSRWEHASVLLQNGKVLIVGGDSYNNYKGCEIFDPQTETFTLAGFCIYPKVDHTLELLPDGRVIAIGGGNSSYEHCEIWDPNTEIWNEIDDLNEPRYNHTSHLLPNGNVMAIAGRWGNHYNNSCEIYISQTNQWTFADSLEIGRTGHCSEKLLNGKILVIGGLSDEIGTDFTCEIYNPETNEWENAPSTYYPYSNFSTEILFDERVLAIKSWSEIYTWNYMPIVSQLQGPTSGIIGEELTFSVTATDPDGDSVSVRIDWGNNEFTEWTELQPSGSTFEFSHSYSQYGEYEIKVQIADQWYFLNELCHNSISEWSEPFIVNIFGIPQISTLTEPLDFGFVYIGEDSTKTISISNTGNGILNVNLGTNTDEFSVWPESFNLEPEESLDVEVTFTPSYEGIIVDVLMILSNDPQYPEIQIELIGEGAFLVGEDENELIPTEIGLSNYPNPFNPSTSIKFSVTQNSDFVTLEIYNLKGQKVKTLIQNEFTKGNHSIVWDGDDESGKTVSSGIYFYHLNVNGKIVAVNKCLLLK